MKNNTLSQEGYNKLERLVDILNKKFKDNANTKNGMDYFEAKDAITKYNSALKAYQIPGVDLSNIDKANTNEIEQKIKDLEGILNPNDPAVVSPKKEAEIKREDYEVILNNMGKTESDDYKRYLELVEKGTFSSLAAKEDAEKTKLKVQYPDFANVLKKYQKLNDAEQEVDELESAKKDLENKLEGTLAIENYQDKEQLKEIDKYYDLKINHPEYKKNVLKIRDKKQEKFDEIKDEYNQGNYGDKYEKDKDEKNFDDLSDDLKAKLQNEKSKYFDQNNNLTNETDFKNRVDEIAKEEKKEQLDKKEKQLNIAQGQVDKYTKNKNISEDQFKDEIEEELRQRNAIFSDEDLVLKQFYDVIVLFEEEIGEREKKIAEIDQELDDMEIELDANGNYTSETSQKLNEKYAEIDEIKKEVDDIKEQIKETKEKMQKKQAFVNKAIDEKEELEKQLKNEVDEEDKEQDEILDEISTLKDDVENDLNITLGVQTTISSTGYNKIFKYFNGTLIFQPNDIDVQIEGVKKLVIDNFESKKKSVKTQEKIDNLNTFIGTRQKVAIQPKTSQAKSQSQSQTISAGQANTGNASQQSQSNQPNQSSKQQQIQNPNNNPTQTQPYTSQVNTNGPVRVNTISARPKDVVDNNNDVVKKGRFSRFKDKVVDKFNSIKEGVKKRYNNFKNGKSNNGKTAQSQTSNTGNSQSSNNKINNNQQNQQSQAQPTIKVQSQTKTQNQNQTNQQQTNNKDDVKKAIEDYEKTEGQIQANVKTQQDIDKFLAENLKDIEDRKYSQQNNGKGQKQQSNNQRSI